VLLMANQPFLAPWARLAGLLVVPERTGLINSTFLVGDPPAFVLQQVNPIFKEQVHADIDAVTRHLSDAGLPTPRLVPADSGALFAYDPDGKIWRVMSYIPGQCFSRVQTSQLAFEAGKLVASFHQAMQEFAYEYQHIRLGVHDTALHISRLEQVAERELPLKLIEAKVLARAILKDWAVWPIQEDLPLQHAHGDLKISNLRFDAEGKGICLLDLDTLGLLPLDIELGDALRSWCNPVGEDSVETSFNQECCSAALDGYSEIIPLSAALKKRLIQGAARIALELAARFCRDVWEDCYFGWNPERFASRAAHNLFRAQGQYTLARQILKTI
jgi:Ser/Thr protein kinase RdoA (MazF antagonist)